MACLVLLVLDCALLVFLKQRILYIQIMYFDQIIPFLPLQVFLTPHFPTKFHVPSFFKQMH